MSKDILVWFEVNQREEFTQPKTNANVKKQSQVVVVVQGSIQAP